MTGYKANNATFTVAAIVISMVISASTLMAAAGVNPAQVKAKAPSQVAAQV